MSNIDKTKLVPAICTQCGGAVEVDPSKEKAVCEFCGTSFFVEKAINNYSIQDAKIDHVESVNIHNNKQGAVQSVLGFVEKQQEKKQKKIDDEKRRIEEEKRKEEERRKKIMNQFFNKKYWKRNSILLGIVIVLIIVLSTLGASKQESDLISHAGEAKTPSGSLIYEGDQYTEAVQDFEEHGFVNIKLDRIEDLVTGWMTKDGEVESISVDGDPDYSPANWYPNDVEVVISYHTFPSKDEEEITKEESEIIEETVLVEEEKQTEEPKEEAEESVVVEEVDYTEINQLIFEDLLMSQGWALGKLDGNGNPTENGTPSASHEFALFIEGISYTGDKLIVSVISEFNALNDEEKTFVINTVQYMSNVHTNHIPYTSIRSNGNIIGHSKVTNSEVFKWD